ncbi:two-component regulator propeller domain-containing protein [uncultured Pontibacter sp.]|uniref:ligand-binding sensor domain-containing protein n=1 Tax=uncultured Pontibacter sp. TaxID=453356 RepID=UPI002633EAE5|nr:two-component regulator propeller domain-containing protein [uncultured Pontibacter sp.]
MNKRPYFAFAVLLALCLLHTLQLAAQQYNFRNWTLEQGLPQSQVNDILQDHTGHLWIATRGGVSRFNGRQFHTYTTENGLSSNNATVLYQAKNRHIWIGSSDRGVVTYNGSSFRKYGAEAGITANTIYDITEDVTGRIWLATEAGLFYSSGSTFTKHEALPEQPYTSIVALPDSTLWAGSQANGLYHLLLNEVNHYTTDNSHLPSNLVTTLFKDTNNDLWIGTDKGAARFKNGALQPFKIPINRTDLAVSSFLRDAYGYLWIGLKQNGLVKYDGKRYTYLIRQNGLRSKRINTLATDSEGNIWIGTNGYGLQQFTSPWFVHYFDFAELSEPRITALAKDVKGRVWVGTDEGNTAYLDGAGRLNWNMHPTWAEGTTVHHISLLDNTTSWVATSNGAWKLTPTASTHFTVKDGLPANEVFQCLPDAATGKVWMSTASGISCYSNGKFKKYTLPGNVQVGRVYQMHKDSRNRIWIGTTGGVYKVEDDKLLEAPELSQFKLEEVTSIAEDGKGVLYFGAFNYGIAVLNPEWSQPKLFIIEQGLPNQGIKGLYVDTQDNLWVGTSRNMLKVLLPKLRQDQKLSYRSYSNANGFRGIEISNNAITQTQDGSIWFGTTKGLTKYIPALDRRNKVYPELSLNEIMLYQKPTNWQQLGYTADSATGLPVKLRLPHTQNHLSFDFHAICLSGPEQVKYKYKLVGYQEQWSAATSQSYATFSNLAPGDYTFELLAQNNDGYWTPKPLMYTFSIVPPIWRREWFIGVLLLVIAGAVLSIVKLRERSLVKMNTLLEMRVNHRTRLLERKNREKEMLLQEIHHRVKNNLQIVISMLNLQARHVQDPQAIDVMRALKSRVRSMAILHERLYRHDNLGEIDLDDYFRGICESLYEAYGVTEEQVELELSIPSIKVDIDNAITLGLIVNELVSNSLKYAFPDFKQKGLLRIVLTPQQNGRYTLTVSDNGKGLPINFEQKMKHSFGLQLVSSLSKKVNGKIDFSNNNGTNSILFFVLPS